MLKELEKEILKIRIELEKTSDKKLKKILIEHKKHLERMRELIGSMYMEYGENLHMSSVEKFNTRRKFETELKDMHKGLSPLEVGIVGSILYGAYKEGYYKTAYTIDKGLSIGINYKILRPEFIDAVINANFEGMTYSDRIWKNKEWLVNRLYDTIGKGIYEGYSVDKMSKEIKDIFGSSAYQSKRLVQNELSRVVSQAQDQIYHDSGVVQELMFVATLDDRTSDICIGLDGNRYKLTDNYPKIPEDTHIMCRSCYVPVVEGWNPKTRRDNITKENISYTKYGDWLQQNNIDD